MAELSESPRTGIQHSIEDVASKVLFDGYGRDDIIVKVSDLKNILTAAVRSEYDPSNLSEAAQKLIHSLGGLGLSHDSPILDAQEEVIEALAAESTAPPWLINSIKQFAVRKLALLHGEC